MWIYSRIIQRLFKMELHYFRKARIQHGFLPFVAALLLAGVLLLCAADLVLFASSRVRFWKPEELSSLPAAVVKLRAQVVGNLHC